MIGQRMKNQNFDKDHPEYVPFSAAYIGHLMIGGIFTFLAAVFYWILSLFFHSLKLDIQEFVVFVVLLVIISELIVTLLQRPIVVRKKVGSPGGVGYALPELLVAPILGTLGAFILFHEIFIAIVFGVILFIFCALNLAYLQPWKPGMTRKDVRDKYNQTKDMIRDEYIEEKYLDVEKDPSHEKLFKKH